MAIFAGEAAAERARRYHRALQAGEVKLPTRADAAAEGERYVERSDRSGCISIFAGPAAEQRAREYEHLLAGSVAAPGVAGS